MIAYVDLLPPLDRAVLRGFESIGIKATRKTTFTLDSTADDIYCAWTLWDRGRRRIVSNQVREYGTPTICFERGWLRGKDHYQIAWRDGDSTGFNGWGKFPCGDGSRWDRMGFDLKPWRKSGNHILVCGNKGSTYKGKISDMINHGDGWPDEIIGRLRELTDRPIWYRPHPKGAEKCLPVRNMPDRIIDPKSETVHESLQDAWCCVVYASSAASQAIIAGVPVIHDAQRIMLHELASNDLSSVENPVMPERLSVLERCAWAQWTLGEIERGIPLARLLEHRP